jgi:hypothetical protein
MAIQFLNSIDLNNIPAEGFAVENLATDPSVSQEGSIYYNTSTDKLKVYTGAGWSEVGGGVTELTVSSGTYVSLTDASAATGSVDLGTVDLSAIDGTSTTATRFLSKDNTWDVPSYTTIDTTNGTYIDLTPTAATGGAVTITADISAIDGTAGANERYLTKNNTWAEIATIPGTYTWTVAGNAGSEAVVSGDTITFAGGPNCTTSYSSGSNTLTINSDNTTYDLSVPTGTTAIRLAATGPSSNDDVIISGTTNEVDITRIGAQELRVGLTDDVTITGELTVSGTGQSSFGGQVTIPATPSAGTDAASKSYVDASVVGNLVYQGGYNAATNTPDLDSSPSASIKKGWTYTVTADGTFFTEQVRVGDVLIAEQDAPTALANWTTVQNNIDLADLTTVGIGNVNAGGAIDVSYASGTATVSVEDSTASNKGAVIVAGGTGISVAYNSGTATVTNTGALGDRVSLTGGSQAGGLTTFTYDVTNSFTGASAIDVKCEVISSAGETVYASVTRSGANLSVEFAGSISNGAYEVLLTYVG